MTIKIHPLMGALRSRALYARVSKKPYHFAALTVLTLLLIAAAGVLFNRTPPSQPTAPTDTQNAGRVILTAEQRRAAGIIVSPLARSMLPPVIRAPAEVRTNDYITKTVGPRITATVMKRHAKLGDVVAQGQVLVTLYSQDMAEAQSGYVLAERDLARYRRLHDTAAISQKDFDQAQSNRQQYYGKLLSYGLTPSQIATLSRKGLTNSATGQFDLVAPIGGTIAKDDFREGDVIVVEQESRPLFEITDPKNIWVEARLAPSLARSVSANDARVIVGGQVRPARVLQTGGVVDESTRTVLVRLTIDNADLLLKPGQFVDVELIGKAEPVRTVPTDAVLRDGAGNWVVYAEGKDGTFEPKRVTLRYTVGDRTAIDGLAEGVRVVTSGAFFVHSEAQKSSFAGED